MTKKKDADAEIVVEILPVLPEDGKIPSLDLFPVVTEKKDVALEGNFDLVKKSLEGRRDEVLKMRVTAKDLDTVGKLKKEAMGYRIYLEEFEKQGKKKYFNAPKEIFAGKVATLQKIVAEMEDKAQKVLDKLEAERAAEVTEVLDIYKAEFQTKYALSPEGLALIEYKPTYYNKTAKEKETKDDLEQQFIARRDTEKALALGEKTIRALCSGKPLLNVDSFIESLKNGTELAIIMDDIAAEDARLTEAQKVVPVNAEPATAPASAPAGFSSGASGHATADPEVVKVGVIGVASRVLAGGTDFPGMTKVKRGDLTYPVDLAPALTEIFIELAKYGITFKEIKEGSF